MARRKRRRTTKPQHTTSSPSHSPRESPPKSPLRRTRPLVVRSSCVKHGSHQNFIPIKHLSLDHLPEHIRSEKSLETVCQIAQLVVRVRVVKSRKSQRRSSRDVGDGGKLSSPRSITCTGLAVSVDDDHVVVKVPDHVLDDQFEVEQATVEFFYDSDSTTNSVVVQGQSLERQGNQTAELTCCACPELGKHFRFRGRPPLLVQQDFQYDVDVDLKEQTEEGTVVVLISHPHGFPKKVTFGRFRGFDRACGTIDTDIVGSSPPHSSSSSSSDMFPSSLAPSSSAPEKEISSQTSDDLGGVQDAADIPNRTFTRQNLVRTLVDVLKKICQLLSFFGRQPLSPRDVSDGVFRLRHDAASCRGSSGGAVLLIGRQDSGGVTSPPVFMHVGTTRGEKLGVAVPLR